jgi:hypothetical protein
MEQKMYVYASKSRNLWGHMTPIVIETDLAWALPYWQARKRINPKIFWTIA